jgi:putative Mg2+ transporter-C (MgtC) family protein
MIDNPLQDLDEIRRHMIPIAVAYVLALPIGWNRARRSFGAGLRTFPLVAVASCGLALMGNQLSGGSADAASRIVQGLITGIGFIGGGAILKSKATISGTATAASVWNIGIVGMAVGFGYYDIGVLLSMINFLTLQFLVSDRTAKQELAREKRRDNAISEPPEMS